MGDWTMKTMYWRNTIECSACGHLIYDKPIRIPVNLGFVLEHTVCPKCGDVKTPRLSEVKT